MILSHLPPKILMRIVTNPSVRFFQTSQTIKKPMIPTPESEGAQPASGTQLPLFSHSDHSATPPQPEPQQEIVPPPDPEPPDPEQTQNEEPTFPIDPAPVPVVDPLVPGPQPFSENEGGPTENEGVSTRPQRQQKPPQSYQPGFKGQS